MSVKVQVSVPPELLAQARTEAVERGGTFSGLVRVSLERELERTETQRELAAEAMTRRAAERRAAA